MSLTPEIIRALGKDPASHKYAHGHALILSGGPGKGGAARLAARGALRIGAGLVTVGCPPAAVAEHAAALTAIMVRPIAGAAGLTKALKDERLNALCVGPGLGLDRHARDLVLAVLASGRPAVLDADALSGFADDSDTLFAAIQGTAVLTPHGGEFRRLFPDLAPGDEGGEAKRAAASAAASRAGATLLFKGTETVIAAPDGAVTVLSATGADAAPWLATAGSGDVLAGFITGLLARGFAPFDAARTAAELHLAAARRFGPGLIAEDLPEAIPGIFRDLGI